MKQLAFIALAVIIIFCRYGLLKAQKALSIEQKANFLDVNSRAWQYVLSLCVFFAGFVFISYAASLSSEFIAEGFYTFSWLILLLLVVLIEIGVRTSNYRRLKKLELPQSFLKTTAVYSTIRSLALVGFVCNLFFLR